PAGLRDVAEACCRISRAAAEAVAAIPGVEVLTPRPFFHEFAIRTPLPAVEVNRGLVDRGIVGGFDLGRHYAGLDNALLLCCTELTTTDHVEQLREALAEIVADGKPAAVRGAR